MIKFYGRHVLQRAEIVYFYRRHLTAEWRIIMMLYPPVAELVEKVGSRYQLVNLVARRARTLSAEAEAHEITLDKKPVSTAIDEVYTGKLTIQ